VVIAINNICSEFKVWFLLATYHTEPIHSQGLIQSLRLFSVPTRPPFHSQGLIQSLRLFSVPTRPPFHSTAR